MKCQFCGRTDARIRASEIPTARITGRAHVDCDGHAQYRNLTVEEWRTIRPLQPLRDVTESREGPA